MHHHFFLNLRNLLLMAAVLSMAACERTPPEAPSQEGPQPPAETNQGNANPHRDGESKTDDPPALPQVKVPSHFQWDGNEDYSAHQVIGIQ